jgi:hypothetical protein
MFIDSITSAYWTIQSVNTITYIYNSDEQGSPEKLDNVWARW